MKIFAYSGPVMYFGTCIDPKYVAVTKAETEAQARNNLAYRYKMNKGFRRNSRITLPGKMQTVS